VPQYQVCHRLLQLYEGWVEMELSRCSDYEAIVNEAFQVLYLDAHSWQDGLTVDFHLHEPARTS
jgi:hypothetical protein